MPPALAQALFQEPGIRRSRALPYELHVHARMPADARRLTLDFQNTGRMGAVFHVYDRLHLDGIPRRYTVEAGKRLSDDWTLRDDEGRYDLWVYAPNGFVREFRGTLQRHPLASMQVELRYDATHLKVEIVATNHGKRAVTLLVRTNAYGSDGPWPLPVASGARVAQTWSVIASHRWYDLTVNGEDFEQRFAGRLENGAPGFSDSAMAELTQNTATQNI
jgi:phospholipase C